MGLSHWAKSEVADECLRIVTENLDGIGILLNHAKTVVDCTISPEEFKYTLFQVFYKVGLVGLKLAAYEGASWADELGQGVSRNQLTNDTSVVTNPAYIRALGVTDHVHKTG